MIQFLQNLYFFLDVFMILCANSLTCYLSSIIGIKREVDRSKGTRPETVRCHYKVAADLLVSGSLGRCRFEGSSLFTRLFPKVYNRKC